MTASGQTAQTGQTWDCGKIPNTVTAELHGGTLTIRGEGSMRDYSVSAYNAPWYAFRDSVARVIIEKGVGSIAPETFWGCTGLKSIYIPYSVLDIGVGAFLGCTGLISINVAPENIYYRSVDGVLFCVREDDYILLQYPAGRRAVSYAVPMGVKTIEKWAFHGCAHLATVSIPSSVTTINRSFVGCSSLMSIEVATSNADFRSADGVLFYTGDEGEYVLLTYPGNRRGAYVIPSGVTRLREKAFLDCTGLTSVTIPNTVLFIENYAFSGCTALTSVVIPRSVLTIENWVFFGCSALTSIDVEPDNPGFHSVDGVLFRSVYGKDELIAFPAGKSGAYAVPDGVDSIESMTFHNCANLTSVVIPDSVAVIGGWAFMECYGLTSVTIGRGVTSVGRGAFMHCHDLTSVICLSAVPPVIEENRYGIFDVFDADIAAGLYVPKKYIGIYKISEGWKLFGTIKSTDDYVPTAVTGDGAATRNMPPEDAVELALASALSGGGFSVGPHSGGKRTVAVNFFRHGSRIENANIYIYDISGEVVKKVNIGDHSNGEPRDDSAKSGRHIGSWDLRDTKGRPVAGGTYLVKGELKMLGGEREYVSVVVDVR